MQIFIFTGSSIRVATSKGYGSPVVRENRRVSCDRSMARMQGTGLLSTMMHSGMDMSSAMVVLVICGGNTTSYGVWCSHDVVYDTCRADS